MEKQAVLSQIMERLNSIGVFPEKQTEADIVVDCEFLDAAWSTGEKKIEYHARATIDEAEGILYFWEFTKDIGSGFSFGTDSQTTFQSGTTLFRKVKSVHYSADGKAYEYNLDIGAITKSFKEVAKANGLKFKVVLKKEKASYPAGVTGLGQTSAPAFVAPQTTTGIGAGVGIVWWILFGVLVGFYLLFFGFGGVSMIGWILGAGVLGAVFAMKKKTAQKGMLASIITGVVSIVVLALIFAFTIKGTSEPANVSDTDQNPPSESSASQQVQQEQPAFFMTMLGSYLWATSSEYLADTTDQVVFYGQVGMALSGNAMNPVGYLGDKVSRIYLTHFEIVKPPAAGKVGFYTMGSNFPSYRTELETRKMPDVYEITIEKSYDDANPGDNVYTNEFGSGSMSFMFGVYDLGVLTPEDFSGDRLAPLKRQNLTSDDLRSTIAFDIVIEITDGQKFVRHIEMDMIGGDFLNAPNGATEEEEQFGVDYTKMPFIKQ